MWDYGFFVAFLESGAEDLLVKLSSGHPGDVQHMWKWGKVKSAAEELQGQQNTSSFSEELFKQTFITTCFPDTGQNC